MLLLNMKEANKANDVPSWLNGILRDTWNALLASSFDMLFSIIFYKITTER